MSDGVEWALHTCLNLSWLDPGKPVPVARLAEFYDLPAAYLNKHLQALVRAGILSSTPGPRGGFQLARPPSQITLLEVVTAISGTQDLFRCQGILQHAPGGRPGADYRRNCVISLAMSRAELAWRRELAGQSLADVRATVASRSPGTPHRTRGWLESSRA